jgi:hypothetical protein
LTASENTIIETRLRIESRHREALAALQAGWRWLNPAQAWPAEVDPPRGRASGTRAQAASAHKLQAPTSGKRSQAASACRNRVPAQIADI